MKKLFLGMVAIVAMFATSCQKEAELGEVTGKTSTVSFNVGTPAIGVRAFSDGKTATKLEYAVYDANGEILNDLTGSTTIDITTTVNLTLTTGNTYSVIFWAAAEEAPYEVNFAEKKMTVDYTNAESNDENRDAFYKYHTFTVTSPQTETIELKRPFAQLNIGTSDYEASEKAGYAPKYSYVKVPVSSELNLVDGTVNAATAVEFKLAAIPTGEDFPVTGYEYLSMNYLLVGAEKETVDIEFGYSENDQTVEKKRTVGSVPVQRNYRTNIYGQLLTSNVAVNVTIDPEYNEPDNTIDNVVINAADLQAALDAAPVGKKTVIRLGADITGDVIEFQKADRDIVIVGGGNKYNGTIKIHNGSNYNNGTFTIQNVNFETATEALNFIMPNEFGVENGVTRRYSNNVTIENCTFTATGAAVNTVVGVQAKTSYNLQVLNCTATGLHSLLQAQSCGTDVIVKNATINGKNGVAFKQVKNAVVEGSTINAVAYGIRFDGNTANYGITVKDNNITASQPFIVRKMTGANNTITLEGENTLTVPTTSSATEAPAYQIVITNGSDDEEYSKPTGTYTLTGAENFLVYPRDVFVTSWTEFTAALTDGAGIVLTENITYDKSYDLKKNVTINLNGKSLEISNPSLMLSIHSQATITNGTIKGKVYARKNSKITFEGVTFGGTINGGGSTEGLLQIQGACDVYAKDCTFNATNSDTQKSRPLSVEGRSSGTLKFENCSFKSNTNQNQVYINPLSGTATLDFTNCNFNNKTPNIMLAATCPFTNLTMSGTTKLSSVTLEINRAKDAVTADDLAYLKEMIANNSFSSVRVFYAGGSEYIR